MIELEFFEVSGAGDGRNLGMYWYSVPTLHEEIMKTTTISICNRRDSSILAKELLALDQIVIQIMSKSLSYALYFYVIVTVSCIFGSVVNMPKIEDEKISLSHTTDATSRLMHSNGKHSIFYR